MRTFLTFLVIGVSIGAVYAIAATGLVVTYVTSNIFNFAHGAIGMFLAFVYYWLRIEQGLPTPIALAVTLLVVAPLIGVTLDFLFMRRIANAPVATKLVVTLALLLAFQGAALAIWGVRLRAFPGFFGTRGFRVFGVIIGWDQLITILTAVAMALALRLLFRRTKIGVAMRAVVDSPELTSLTGLSPRRVTAVSWALGSMLAGLAAILIAPGFNLEIFVLSLLVVSAYAAAVVGRLQSVPLTFAGAVALGVSQSLIIAYLPGANELVRSLRPSMPFILLFVMLLIRKEARLHERSKAPAEPPPPTLRTTVIVAVLAVIVAMLAVGRFSDYQIVTGSGGLIFACVALSLVLLTGLSGQVSLTQMSFAGIGAVVMGFLPDAIPSVPALLISALVAAGVGAIVALPALRLHGLYLALSTLAFALMMDNMVFGNRELFGGGESIQVRRIALPGISFESESAMFVLLTAVLGIFGIGFLALRRASFGRILAAMRDSPDAAAMLGLNLVATKLRVFTLSAFLAGVAGALLGGLQVRIGAIDFSWFRSLTLLLVVTIFGITSVSGALLAALFFVVLPEVTKNLFEGIQPLLIAFGMIALLSRPEGLAGVIRARLRPFFAFVASMASGRPLAMASGPAVAPPQSNAEEKPERVGARAR